MPDYQLGKIYVVRNTVNEKLYVGSTTMPLCKRMAGHRAKSKAGTPMNLYSAFKELGVESFYIELKEDFPCERNEQLRAREGHWIRELNTVATGYNNRIAGRTPKDYYVENRPAFLAKYAANAEVVCARVRQYQAAHSDEIKARHREARDANIEEVRAKDRARRDANLDHERARDRARYAANREKRLAGVKANYAANKDKINAAQKARRAAKKAGEAAAALAAVVI